MPVERVVRWASLEKTLNLFDAEFDSAKRALMEECKVQSDWSCRRTIGLTGGESGKPKELTERRRKDGR